MKGFLKGMSMHTKLLVCFCLVAAVATISAVFSVATVRRLQSQMRMEIVGSAARLDQARQITIGLASMRSAMRGVSLFAVRNKAELAAKSRAAFDATAAEMRATLQRMESAELQPEDRTAVKAMQTALEQWIVSFKEFADRSLSGHGEEAADEAVLTMTPLMDAIQIHAQEFGETNAARRDAAIAATEGAIQRNELVTLFFLALALLAGGGGFLAVTSLVKTLERIATSLATGTEQVAQAAAQVSSSSQKLAQGATQSAASLEETSASTEEIRSMAGRNTENSQNAAGIVGRSEQKFQVTKRALDDMVMAMGEIHGSSQKISKIIKVIDEIAFQTNILALNAAVEAARAGEAGMGFAVVADEVRNLAQRCAQAARDTAALIEESIAKSDSGKSRVDRVAEAIRGITAESAQVKTLVDEVSLGSQEQARGLDQIGKAILQMEGAGQMTAATAEESAAAAEQLTAQSGILTEAGAQLRELMDGSSATGRPAGERPR